MATRLHGASFQETVITSVKATINEYINIKLLFYKHFHFSISVSPAFKNYIHGGVTGIHIPGILATLHIIIFIIPVYYYNEKTKT